MAFFISDKVGLAFDASCLIGVRDFTKGAGQAVRLQLGKVRVGADGAFYARSGPAVLSSLNCDAINIHLGSR